MSRKDRCDAHPLEPRNTCRTCLGDHKADEHRGHPSPDCPACRIEARVAELRHNRHIDARRRQAGDY